MIRHLILVGLPGAGKTTVGRRVAALLTAEFTDLDAAIEAEAGRSVAAIFARAGEAAFRQLERLAMERALARPPHVIAAGAGWAAEPGNFAAAMARRASVVYLRISVATADRRLAGDATRPLLAGPARPARLAALLLEREAWYRKADREVEAEADVETVTAKVVASVGGLTEE